MEVKGDEEQGRSLLLHRILCYLPLSVTQLLVLKSYMREWKIWSHGQVAMEMRNGVCVFWRAEDSVLGLFYRQLLYSDMPALLNCRPLFPTPFLMPIIALTFLLYHGRKPGGWTSEKTVMGLVKLGDFLLFLELLLGVRQRWV